MAETGRNADALQQEIERTRDELARTVDNIADRVSPKNVAQRTFQQVKDDAAAARKKLPSGGGTNDSHGDLATQEIESQAPSGGSHRATGSSSTAMGAVGQTLQANRTVVLVAAGVVVAVTVVTVATRRRGKQ